MRKRTKLATKFLHGEDSAFPMVSSSSSASQKYDSSVSLSPDSSWKIISVVSQQWKSSRSLGSYPVGEVYPAREQDSSDGGGTGNNCLVVVHMEEGVQVRVQVEVGRAK